MVPKVRLGDVVARIKDKVNKDDCDLEYYVGGEHFEYGEVRVTHKAEIQGSTIGPAFHMRFQKNDVLLMSRNPHLRKAGMVDFVGLCSDVSYVCRTKNENVLMQSFLPFVLQTDDFWSFAEANKKGSTNFFLNWSDFEKYEFDLPDIESQRKLSTLLWAMERTKTAYKDLIAMTDELVKSQFVEMFSNRDYPIVKLSEIATVTSGLTKNSNRPNFPIKMPYLRVANVFFNQLDLSDVQEIGLQESEVKKTLLQKDDLLFVEGNGSPEQIGRVALWDGSIEPMSHQNHIIKARMKSDSMIPGFAMYYFMLPIGRAQILESAVSTSGLYTLSVGKISNFALPMPPRSEQESFMAIAAQADKSKFAAQQALADLTATQKALMRQYLG